MFVAFCVWVFCYMSVCVVVLFMLYRCVCLSFAVCCVFFFSSRRRHTRCLSDWSSDVCSSDLDHVAAVQGTPPSYHTPDEDVYLPGRNVILFGKAGVFCATAGIGRLAIGTLRSEERRVGREGSCHWRRRSSRYDRRPRRNPTGP